MEIDALDIMLFAVVPMSGMTMELAARTADQYNKAFAPARVDVLAVFLRGQYISSRINETFSACLLALARDEGSSPQS